MANLMKPKSFLRSSEGQIISYDWVDISSGSGYQTFYLCKDQTNYNLTTQTIYSDEICFLSGEPPQALTKIFDQVFTITMNSGRIINGNVLVNPCAHVKSGGSVVVSLYFVCKLVKIFGGVETTIAEATSSTMSNTLADIGSLTPAQVLLCSIPVTNYKINAGEKLGLRLEGWTNKNSGSTGFNVVIGYDPKNRTSAGSEKGRLVTTNSQINIPFKLDN
jgi:hypothetical protein